MVDLTPQRTTLQDCSTFSSYYSTKGFLQAFLQNFLWWLLEGLPFISTGTPLKIHPGVLFFRDSFGIRLGISLSILTGNPFEIHVDISIGIAPGRSVRICPASLAGIPQAILAGNPPGFAGAMPIATTVEFVGKL